MRTIVKSEIVLFQTLLLTLQEKETRLDLLITR